MKRREVFVLVLALVAAVGVAAQGGVDISGRWTATFDTQVGEQNYTYEFRVSGNTLTGTASSANGTSELTSGKVEGDTVTFTESLSIMGMVIPVTYQGKIVSASEIQFTRQVGEFATETLVAKRMQ
ncbi:MAG: hypothetical protein AB7K63_06495 [Vicinamibacterales bacterium]